MAIADSVFWEIKAEAASLAAYCHTLENLAKVSPKKDFANMKKAFSKLWSDIDDLKEMAYEMACEMALGDNPPKTMIEIASRVEEGAYELAHKAEADDFKEEADAIFLFADRALDLGIDVKEAFDIYD